MAPCDDSGRLPVQPVQPAHGPGSSDYLHATVHVSRQGHGPNRFWIFTPNSPEREQAPVIVFLHGWGSTEPEIYGAWIKHLVRRGAIVVFPGYQDSLRTLPREFAGRATAAIQEAIAQLRATGPTKPDLERVAFVGHSMGAILCANIAQSADRWNLPTPRALFLAEPAFQPLLGNYDRIPDQTLLAIAVGADVKRDASARRILRGTTQIPSANKYYIALPSDLHGNPPLVSDHFAPCAVDLFDESSTSPRPSKWRGLTRDAIDYFGYWKLCDSLLETAFGGRNRTVVLGDSPELRFMGVWSDGTPVQEARVIPLEAHHLQD